MSGEGDLLREVAPPPAKPQSSGGLTRSEDLVDVGPLVARLTQIRTLFFKSKCGLPGHCLNWHHDLAGKRNQDEFLGSVVIVIWARSAGWFPTLSHLLEQASFYISIYSTFQRSKMKFLGPPNHDFPSKRPFSPDFPLLCVWLAEGKQPGNDTSPTRSQKDQPLVIIGRLQAVLKQEGIWPDHLSGQMYMYRTLQDHQKDRKALNSKIQLK